MKKTIPELFEESRRNYLAQYGNHKTLQHVFLQDGKASIAMGYSRSEEVSLEELQHQYLLVVISVAAFHVMCLAIAKDAPDFDEQIRSVKHRTRKD